MQFTQEHEELRRTVRNFVEKELNPHVKEWEEAGRLLSFTRVSAALHPFETSTTRNVLAK